MCSSDLVLARWCAHTRRRYTECIPCAEGALCAPVTHSGQCSIMLGSPHADDTLGASRVRREPHAFWSFTPAITQGTVPPAQMIHSVHPACAGSPMRSGQSLWLTPSSVVPPHADDTLGASRVQRGHHALRSLTPAIPLRCGGPLHRRYTRCIPSPEAAPCIPVNYSG